MSEAFVGEIRLLPFTYAPRNWALCNGQTLSIRMYTSLFALLNTTYGGDGKITFGLPNLIGNLAVGMGQMPGGSNNVVGTIFGTTNVTLTQVQMAMHGHTLVAATGTATTASASGNDIAAGIAGSGREAPEVLMYSTGGPDIQLNSQSLQSSGNGLQHSNMMPSLGMAYCICLNCTFPQRP